MGVASQISSDNNWYRARVVNVIAPEDEYDESLIEVDIEFVDFGDCERKSITSVFKLLNDYLNLNFQAIECCLADVGPKEFHNPFNSLDDNESNNGWSEAAADDFEKLTHASHWKVILAKLKGYKNRASNKDRDEKNEESINRCSDSISSNPLNLSDIPDIPYVELVDINSEQDININQKLVTLEHAVYLDGRDSILQSNNETSITTEISETSDYIEDEGIDIKENGNVNMNVMKPNIENVMEEFVYNIVDKSLAQSMGNTS